MNLDRYSVQLCNTINTCILIGQPFYTIDYVEVRYHYTLTCEDD